jgi:hypothetical protein
MEIDKSAIISAYGINPSSMKGACFHTLNEHWFSIWSIFLSRLDRESAVDLISGFTSRSSLRISRISNKKKLTDFYDAVASNPLIYSDMEQKLQKHSFSLFDSVGEIERFSTFLKNCDGFILEPDFKNGVSWSDYLDYEGTE